MSGLNTILSFWQVFPDISCTALITPTQLPDYKLVQRMKTNWMIQENKWIGPKQSPTEILVGDLYYLALFFLFFFACMHASWI